MRNWSKCKKKLHFIGGSSPPASGVFCGRCRASVGALVEVIQNGGVGSLKQPLLAERGRVARVHEDPPLVGAAVDAAVTDRVIQTLVLQDGGRERDRKE